MLDVDHSNVMEQEMTEYDTDTESDDEDGGVRLS